MSSLDAERGSENRLEPKRTESLKKVSNEEELSTPKHQATSCPGANNLKGEIMSNQTKIWHPGHFLSSSEASINSTSVFGSMSGLPIEGISSENTTKFAVIILNQPIETSTDAFISIWDKGWRI